MSRMKVDRNCTYTKWRMYYERVDETTFIIYKTRFRHPNYWPKNISSKGYEETIKLATIHASLQNRYVVGHHLTGYYVSDIEWNKEVNIGFMDRFRVQIKALYIDKHELHLVDQT